MSSGSSSSADPGPAGNLRGAYSRYGSRTDEASTGYAPVSGRSRGGQPIAGTAGPRPIYGGDDTISFPLYGPWGNWYPWYYSGFGWGVGFVGYNPWYYPATCWNWGYYGMWYSPSCYYWDPMWAGPVYASSGSGERVVKDPEPGSIRIRANVSQARVYVDNALAGTVDEFDGLSDHLKLDRGTYVLELRADGYETVSKEITVAPGKTQTVRLSLKKK